MQLLDVYIWADLKEMKDMYNLVLVMPKAQMNLNEILKEIKLTFD
jgi:hypothetical protein